MKVVVVGARAQGAPCAAVLARQPGVKRVLVGSSKLEAAETARRHIGGDKVLAAQIDARDPAAVVAVVFDQAARALDLFGSANMAVGHAAATEAVQVSEGGMPAGIVWPEELDPVRFLAITNSLGLEINYDLVG